MTTISQARSLSAVRGKDWRYRLDDQELQTDQTEQQLADLKCPFACRPEMMSSVPAEYAINVRFYQLAEEGAPWTVMRCALVYLRDRTDIGPTDRR
jgi:hypothetical protein